MYRKPLFAFLYVSMMFAATMLPSRVACGQVCDPGWVPGPMTTALPGTDGPVYAMVVYGSPARLIVAGEFTHVGGVAANNIAAWDGTNWSNLGGGTDGTVRSLVVYNNLLIAGGEFLSPGRRIAAWNGSTWTAMGDIGSTTPSLSEGVFAMQEFNGHLHVGGRFDLINGVGITSNSARYLNGTWSVAAGMTSIVRAMTVYDWDDAGPMLPTLYIGGGGFGHRLASSTDGVNVTEIDGPNGGDVWSLTTWNGFLPPKAVVVGGPFDQWLLGGDNSIQSYSIARLLGPGNQALNIGGGLTNVNVSTIPNVMSMCAFGEDLYIGGAFQRAGGLPAPSIARFDQSENSWATVAGGLMRGESKLPLVYAMCVYNGFLYVGGRFDAADNQPSIVGVQNIARWNGSIWGSVGTKPRARAMASLGNRLFVGGEFGHVVQEPGGQALNRFNLLTWDGVNTGCLGRGANGIVRSLLAYNTGGALPANVVIAGGDFTTVYGDTLNPSAPIAASRVAQWVEPSIGLPGWSAMGAGLNSFVHCLTRFNGSIVAGGSFTASGATTTNRIAKYVGSPPSWQPLTSPDPGINNTVFAMKAFTDEFGGQNNYLIFGGAFTAAPATGVAANRILMRVENPVFGQSSYQALGQGFANGFVMAIERHGSGFNNARTYAGGSFTMSGTTTVNRIAVLNGSNWQPVGNGIGFNNVVYGLRSIGNYLYAVGAFTSVDGIAANRIARWNGSAWSAVDFGADDEANAVMAFQNEVMMGGFFTSVDSPTKVSPALARFSEFGLPWIAQQPAPDTVACGGTAEFTVTAAAGYDVTYQWRRANIPVFDGPTPIGSVISGATTATLTITNAQPGDDDLYDCVVSTLCDGVASADALLTITGTCAPLCPADIAPAPVGDGFVNVDDLLAVINAWGPCANPNDCPADIAPVGSGNDLVDVDDLLAVINAWGACPN